MARLPNFDDDVARATAFAFFGESVPAPFASFFLPLDELRRPAPLGRAAPPIKRTFLQLLNVVERRFAPSPTRDSSCQTRPPALSWAEATTFFNQKKKKKKKKKKNQAFHSKRFGKKGFHLVNVSRYQNHCTLILSKKRTAASVVRPQARKTESPQRLVAAQRTCDGSECVRSDAVAVELQHV